MEKLSRASRYQGKCLPPPRPKGLSAQSRREEAYKKEEPRNQKWRLRSNRKTEVESIERRRTVRGRVSRNF